MRLSSAVSSSITCSPPQPTVVPLLAREDEQAERRVVGGSRIVEGAGGVEAFGEARVELGEVLRHGPARLRRSGIDHGQLHVHDR